MSTICQNGSAGAMGCLTVIWKRARPPPEMSDDYYRRRLFSLIGWQPHLVQQADLLHYASSKSRGARGIPPTGRPAHEGFQQHRGQVSAVEILDGPPLLL